MRLQRDAAASPPVIESLLAAFLLQQFAWGFMSPQLIRKIASLAVQDAERAQSTGGVLKDLQNISKIGGSGHLDNNMHRDLQPFLSKTKIPPALKAQFPFKTSGFQQQSIVLPHELFAALCHDYPNAWQTVLLPEQNLLQEFWAAQAEHPNMIGNPIQQRPNYTTKCLPLGLHGDEVPITGKGKVWSKSFLTFEWLSLLGRGWGPARMFFIWGGFDKLLDISDTGTLAYFWKILAWSFFWLLQGTWPTHDWQGNQYGPDTAEGQKAGTYLANGYFAIIWALMGDLDYLAKTLHLPRSTSHNPCSLCRCTLNGDTSWKFFAPNASWRNCIWKPLDWIGWSDRSKIGLFSIPGISAVTVGLDYMHNKYLGTDQPQFGSVLYMLCYMVLPDSPIQNLLACWDVISKYYVDHNCRNRYGSITKLSMFLRKSGVIKMRGKAAELKGLGAPLLFLWEKYMNPGLDVHRKVRLLLKLNCKMEAIVDTYSDCFKLPAEIAAEFLDACWVMYELEKELHQHFLDDEDCDKKLFSLTSKAHMVMHSAMLSGTISPRLIWCFMGEDFMRKIQKLAESCVRGVKGTNVSQKMTMHYRLALHMELLSLE